MGRDGITGDLTISEIDAQLQLYAIEVVSFASLFPQRR